MLSVLLRLTPSFLLRGGGALDRSKCLYGAAAPPLEQTWHAVVSDDLVNLSVLPGSANPEGLSTAKALHAAAQAAYHAEGVERFFLRKMSKCRRYSRPSALRSIPGQRLLPEVA